MLRVKDSSVKLTALCPQIVLALHIADSVWVNVGLAEQTVITSANDGRHSRTSLHYVGHAVDIRTKNVNRLRLETCIHKLREALGADYDVVMEDVNGPNEHCHVEWQPKRRL